MKGKENTALKHKPSVLSVASLVVLIFYSLVFITAIAWAIMISLTDYETEILYVKGRNFLVFPDKLCFNNYARTYEVFRKEVVSGAGNRMVYLPEMFLNSVLYAVGVGIASAFAPCLVGYCTAKFDFKFNKVLDSIVLITIILPVVGALPSQIKIVYGLNMNDSIPGLWVMAFGFANMYYFVFKAIFKGVPDSLKEAAQIDGASNFYIFVRIMLPLVMPTFISVAVLQFVNAWNNYTTPLAFAPNKPTAAFGFFSLVQATQTSEPTLKMSGAILLMFPILLLYCFLNKFMSGNLTVGSVKG